MYEMQDLHKCELDNRFDWCKLENKTDRGKVSCDVLHHHSVDRGVLAKRDCLIKNANGDLTESDLLSKSTNNVTKNKSDDCYQLSSFSHKLYTNQPSEHCMPVESSLSNELDTNQSSEHCTPVGTCTYITNLPSEHYILWGTPAGS